MSLFARHGGSDDGDEAMSMGDSISSAHGMPSMTGFHAGAGDTLWLSGFTPASGAAVFGACVLLFFIAVVMRFCEGLHRSLTLHWAERATREHDERQSATSTVPFLPASDVTRGVLVMLQAGLMYLMMLAVMTYNVYYFVSILIGVFVGEMLFGRFGRPHLSPHRLTRRADDDEVAPLNTLHIQEHTKQY